MSQRPLLSNVRVKLATQIQAQWTTLLALVSDEKCAENGRSICSPLPLQIVAKLIMVNAMSMLFAAMMFLHLPSSVLARLVIPIQVLHLLRMAVAQVCTAVSMSPQQLLIHASIVLQIAVW